MQKRFGGFSGVFFVFEGFRFRKSGVHFFGDALEDR